MWPIKNTGRIAGFCKDIYKQWTIDCCQMLSPNPLFTLVKSLESFVVKNNFLNHKGAT